MIIYTISFETILIKIINYINMTLNIKNDGINFSQTKIFFMCCSFLFLRVLLCLNCGDGHGT